MISWLQQIGMVTYQSVIAIHFSENLSGTFATSQKAAQEVSRHAGSPMTTNDTTDHTEAKPILIRWFGIAFLLSQVALMILLIRKSGFSLSDYGVTTNHWKKSLMEGIMAAGAVILGLLFLKLWMIHTRSGCRFAISSWGLRSSFLVSGKSLHFDMKIRLFRIETLN